MINELEKLRELVEVQNTLIKGYERFSSSMPFYMGDMIEGYSELIEEMDILKEELSIK